MPSIVSELVQLTEEEEHHVNNYHDIVLVVGRKLFWLNRVVLASRSQYFAAMFQSGMREQNATRGVSVGGGHRQQARRVIMHGFDPDTFGSIVEYIYSGNCDINMENALRIMQHADQLLLPELVDRCRHFLVRRLNSENALKLWNFASFVDTSYLTDVAKRYVLEHVLEVSRTDHWFQLSAPEVISILSDDRLNIVVEEDVFDLMSEWLKRRSADINDDDTSALLRCVRTGFMHSEFVNELLQSHEQIARNAASKDRYRARIADVDAHIRAHTDDQLLYCTSSSHLDLRPRTPATVMFTIGGWTEGRPCACVETYDRNVDQWYSHPQPPSSSVIAYHGVAVIDNSVYVIGGFDGSSYFAETRRYDVEFDRWSSVANMFTQRCYVAVTTLGRYVYAVGGYNGRQRLDCCEIYNADKNRWKRIPNMNQRRSDAAISSMNDKIYIAGGFSGSECLDTCEYYDPSVQQWTEFQLLPGLRTGGSMQHIGGLLYLVGGYDGDDRLNTGYKYDPQTKTWTSITNMIINRSNFGCVTFDGLIYVLGGFDGMYTITDCEVYDPATDAWTEIGKLNKGKSALSACLLTNLASRERFTFHGQIPDVVYDVLKQTKMCICTEHMGIGDH